jgi:hypothetical protein
MTHQVRVANAEYQILEAMMEAALETRNWPTYYVDPANKGYRDAALHDLRF